MPTATRHASRPFRAIGTALAAVLVAGALAAGCGGGDTSSSSPTTADSAATLGDDARTGAAEASADVLGYKVTAEPGTVLEVVLVAVADGVEQPPLTQTPTVGDEPWQQLFSGFVDSAELTVEVTKGDAATFEVIRGHSADPEDPFAGIEVVETLDTVEVIAGTLATVTAP